MVAPGRYRTLGNSVGQVRQVASHDRACDRAREDADKPVLARRIISAVRGEADFGGGCYLLEEVVWSAHPDRSTVIKERRSHGAVRRQSRALTRAATSRKLGEGLRLRRRDCLSISHGTSVSCRSPVVSNTTVWTLIGASNTNRHHCSPAPFAFPAQTRSPSRLLGRVAGSVPVFEPARTAGFLLGSIFSALKRQGHGIGRRHKMVGSHHKARSRSSVEAPGRSCAIHVVCLEFAL